MLPLQTEQRLRAMLRLASDPDFEMVLNWVREETSDLIRQALRPPMDPHAAGGAYHLGRIINAIEQAPVALDSIEKAKKRQAG